MSISFEWKNDGKDLPIEAVFYHPRNRTLMIQFRSQKQAADSEARIRSFDKGCQVIDQEIVMSRGGDPQLLGSYLLEQGMIGRKCYDEMQRELREYMDDYGIDTRGR